jgi:crotonobetainyl-CoA:carnitine CoA-transferase CaiB-like acyl-CoA transferase
MTGILAGLRIIEGSAFIAAPLGGMTLAQLGADVIRFDDIKGGLDNDRWPITQDGRSIYWADLNKGKRSIAVDLRSPRGRELWPRSSPRRARARASSPPTCRRAAGLPTRSFRRSEPT